MEKLIEFEGGGILKFELVEGGVKLLFQASHFSDALKVTSMNVILTLEEARDIIGWLTEVIK